MSYVANVENWYGNKQPTMPNIIYVDTGSPSPDGEGRTWQTAFHTIQAAINKVRYDSVTGTFDYDEKDRMHVIYIKPGHYNITSYISFSGYNISIIGVGPGIPGKDYGVSINYDGAVDATAVMAGSGAGLTLKNLHITVAEAIPGILVSGDNNLVENCVLEGDGTNATIGIDAYGLKGSAIRNCRILGFITAGIYVRGGADRYFRQGDVSGNSIVAPSSAGAKGIYVDTNLVTTDAIVKDNFVDVNGGGATGKGIDVNDTGVVFVHNNCVYAATSGTGIEHAGHGVMANNVSVAGTMQGDNSHSFVDDGATG